MERVTFEEYEAAKAAVLYGKEYEEKSSMENNVIHKQYVCKDGSGIFYERTENGVTEFWSTEYSKSRIYADKADEKVELSENRKKAIKRLYKLVYWFADEMLNEEDAEKSWTDAASQLGAFTSLENAKSACKAGYTVYDDNGKAVYTTAGQQASAGVPFSVQVDILDLNIRTGAGTNYAKTGEKTGKGVFTIVEVKAGQGASTGWGRLKSGAGWISLDYATRLA